MVPECGALRIENGVWCRLCIMFYRQSFFGSDVSTSAIPPPPPSHEVGKLLRKLKWHISCFIQWQHRLYTWKVSVSLLFTPLLVLCNLLKPGVFISHSVNFFVFLEPTMGFCAGLIRSPDELFTFGIISSLFSTCCKLEISGSGSGLFVKLWFFAWLVFCIELDSISGFFL